MPPENGLFKTAEELKEEYKKRLKGKNGGGKNWYTDRVKGGITRDDDNNIQRSGLAWWLQGLEQEGFAETAADRNRDLSEATKIETLTEGEDLDSLEKAAGGKKITGKNVKSIVNKAKTITRNTPTPIEEKQLGLLEKAETRATTQQQDATDIARETLKDQKDGRESTQTLMLREMQQQAVESRLDRAERADQRADDRMMQLEMYERADAKEEKNRRRESIQALVAGLSSLGAAFAV